MDRFTTLNIFIDIYRIYLSCFPFCVSGIESESMCKNII